MQPAGPLAGSLPIDGFDAVGVAGLRRHRAIGVSSCGAARVRRQFIEVTLGVVSGNTSQDHVAGDAVVARVVPGQGDGIMGRRAGKSGGFRWDGLLRRHVGHAQRVSSRLVAVPRHPRVVGPALRGRERHPAVPAVAEIIVVAGRLVASRAVVDRPEVGVGEGAAPARAAREVELVGPFRCEVHREAVVVARGADGAGGRAADRHPTGRGVVVGQVRVALGDAGRRGAVLRLYGMGVERQGDGGQGQRRQERENESGSSLVGADHGSSFHLPEFNSCRDGRGREITSRPRRLVALWLVGTAYWGRTYP